MSKMVLSSMYMFYKENLNNYMSDKLSFTDWILELSFKTFFWGLTGVIFAFWVIAIAALMLIMMITDLH